jgi:hypothetical protein
VEGDDHCEAYTAIVWGELLSRERRLAEAEAVEAAEGNMSVTAMRGRAAPPWSKTSSRTKGSCRNLRDLRFGPMARAVRVRVGKAMSRSRR